MKKSKKAQPRRSDSQREGEDKKISRNFGKETTFNRELSSKEQDFAQLQKKWYAKLSKSGFSDIEWIDHKTGYGHDAPFRKKPLSHLRSKYDPLTEEHFRRCRIFLEHHNWTSKIDKQLMTWYTEGLSLREIVKEIATRRSNKVFKKSYSLYWVHVHLTEVLDYMELWHVTDPEGLDNPGAQDFFVEDIPLKPSRD